MAREVNEYGFEIFKGGHGRKENQKLKTFLVLQYLMRESDESHVVSAKDIVGYLQQECGIDAERRSIYKDIEEINKAMLIVEDEISVDEAEQRLAENEDEKTVVYDKNKKGFYVRYRRFDLFDIRLLAECVYSAKFIEKGQAERLVDVVAGFVGEAQRKNIRHDALLTDRVKTDNKSVLANLSEINDALSEELDGKRHEPEKISFKYIRITNNSFGAVKVDNVKVEAGTGWKLTAFGSKDSLAKVKVDSNMIGFKLALGGGAEQLTNAENAASQTLIDGAIEGCYMSGSGDQTANSIAVSYDAIVSPVSEAVVNASVASVLFVICWDAV